MSVDFEDYLEAEVFDDQGGLIGIFNCLWTDDDDQAQFLGIKLKCSPDRTCLVPGILGNADERRSCIRIHALEQHIAGAPSLDCDEQLDQKFEEKVYAHFRLDAPSKHHELHLNRAHSD
jgi:hypothetical protein